MRNSKKYIQNEIDLSQPTIQTSEPELYLHPSDDENSLLSHSISNLVLTFCKEAKAKINTASLIKLYNQFFQSVQIPILIVNQDFQQVCSNLGQNIKSKSKSNLPDFKEIFEKTEFDNLKLSTENNLNINGPYKTAYNDVEFLVYNTPFKTKEKNTFYNLMILKPCDKSQTLNPLSVEQHKETTYPLFKNHNIFGAFLDSFDGFYFLADTSLKILFISGLVDEKLGYNAQNLIGRSLHTIIPLNLNKECFNEIKSLNALESLVTKKFPIKKEIVVSDKDKNLTFFELGISLHFNESNNEKYFVCICSDIHERKMRENELFEAKLTAEQKDQMKSEFLSNMSHEIRTPLNGILGFSAMLDREGSNAEKRQKYMKIIRSSSRQLLTLVNDIIDFSKIEAGQLKIFPRKFEVNTIIEELFVAYNQELVRLSKEHILLEKVLENHGKKLYLNTDEVRLHQVFVNLLNNAIKFTNSGRVSFGYSFVNNRKSIRFFVRDTGIGIPIAQQELIFGRFLQTPEGSKQKYMGTGLGLAISKGIVELLGSKLEVESKIDIGSEFYFVVPIS